MVWSTIPAPDAELARHHHLPRRLRGRAQILHAGPVPDEVAGVSQINFQVPQLSPGTYTVYMVGGFETTGHPLSPDYNAVSLAVGQP